MSSREELKLIFICQIKCSQVTEDHIWSRIYQELPKMMPSEANVKGRQTHSRLRARGAGWGRGKVFAFYPLAFENANVSQSVRFVLYSASARQK